MGLVGLVGHGTGGLWAWWAVGLVGCGPHGPGELWARLALRRGDAEQPGPGQGWSALRLFDCSRARAAAHRSPRQEILSSAPQHLIAPLTVHL